MKKYFFLFVISILELNSFSQGTTATVSQGIKGNLNSVLNLNLSNSKPLNFIFNTTADYENGKSILEGSTFKVTATRSWIITAKAISPNFTATSGGSNNLPCEVLFLKDKNSSIYHPLKSSANSTPIINGKRGDEYALNHEIAVDYLLKPGYSYIPGNYSIDILFTISAY